MKYKDKGRYVRLPNIQMGDTVLKEQKAIKAHPPYTPSTTPSPRYMAQRSRLSEA